MEDIKSISLAGALSAIAKGEVHPAFGEPFLTAFKAAVPTMEAKAITAAAYTCSLFLSTVLAEFPSSSLHTFANYTKEHCSRFSFDCKMYPVLLEQISGSSIERVALFDSHGATIFKKCSKEDIKDAFDFYTNR